MSRKYLLIAGVFPLILLSATPSFALWWMGYHKPAFNGRVIDAATKEPVEGAVVVVTYDRLSIRIAPESMTETVDVRETLTDKGGYFHIPSFTTIIDPLSREDMATFIIYKPGYGKFPNQQVIPAGIAPVDQEVFFSKATGSAGELELWVKVEGKMAPDLKKFNVTFGVVELPMLKTREERIKAKPAPVGEKSDWKKQRQFIKAIREEWQYLYSEDPGNLYKIEEE